jgi:GNAT superfamily N-acetyltransferase
MSETTSQFVFREIGADGIDAVRALWEKLNLHHAQMSPRFGGQLSLRTFVARKQELLAKADAGKLWVMLVASGSDGGSVAYCICTVSADGIGEIDSIFIEEHLRGQGIGTELMRRALAWLDGMRVTSKIVPVMYENDEALAFYRHFGFYPRTMLLQDNCDGQASPVRPAFAGLQFLPA